MGPPWKGPKFEDAANPGTGETWVGRGLIQVARIKVAQLQG